MLCAIRQCSLRLLLVVSALSLFVGCSRDPLAGRWERLGDDFAGTMVNVQRSGSGLSARLVKIPPSLKARGFVPCDVKWRNLTLVSDSEGVRTYKGQDLGKFQVKDSTGRLEIRYSEFKLLVKADTAWARVFQNELDVTGLAQIWRKVR